MAISLVAHRRSGPSVVRHESLQSSEVHRKGEVDHGKQVLSRTLVKTLSELS